MSNPTNTCCICLEGYMRGVNEPVLCSPCGHGVCKPCIEQWFRTNPNRTCPYCRTRITNYTINRSLMDTIENNSQSTTSTIVSNTNDSTDSGSVKSLFKFNEKNEKKNEKEEVIQDKCDEAYYVVDNSGSMSESDGKIFTEEKNGSLRTVFGVTRWEEARYKVLQIANYNVNRNIKATYYLLNPQYRQKWVENIDFIFIDPSLGDTGDKLKLLENELLSSSQIRGNTPLDQITEKLITELTNSKTLSSDYTINYNVITDGCPNSKRTFENSLKRLAKKFPVFLTINLTTEDDSVVEYYNGLDKTIGNELSGMDVIDDLKSEALEIVKAGNTFFTYSNEIHICRMAGCFSVVADLLDEEPLSLYHSNKLIKEIMHLPKDAPHWTDSSKYLEVVKIHNREVFDIYYNTFRPLVNINTLRYRLFMYNQKQELFNFYIKNKLVIFGCISVCTLLLINLVFS